MPRKGYKSTGKNSLPEEVIKAVEKLLKDPKFIREMRMKGYGRISRALVIRIALLEFLERKGVDISQIFETENK